MKSILEHNDSGQPVLDGGYGWVCVVAAFVIRLVLSGQLKSFGVLLLPLTEAFETEAAKAGLVSGVAYALTFAASPIGSALVNKYGHRKIICAGALFGGGGLILSFFANSLWVLYLTYGVIFGAGSGVVLNPSISIIPRYFRKRVSAALGIASLGAGVGSFTFPVVIQGLLDAYNYKGAFLICGGITLNVFAMGLLMKPAPKLRSVGAEENSDNDDASSVGTSVKTLKFHWEILRDTKFILMTLAAVGPTLSIVQNYIWLGVKATEIEGGNIEGAYVISVLSFSETIFRIVWAVLWDQPCCRSAIRRFSMMAAFNLIIGILMLFVGAIETDWLLLSYAFLLGILMGGIGSLGLPILVDILGASRFGDGMAALLLAEAVIILIAPTVTGSIYDNTGSVSTSYIVMGSLLIVSCPLCLVIPFTDKLCSKRSELLAEEIEVGESAANGTDNGGIPNGSVTGSITRSVSRTSRDMFESSQIDMTKL